MIKQAFCIEANAASVPSSSINRKITSTVWEKELRPGIAAGRYPPNLRYSSSSSAEDPFRPISSAQALSLLSDFFTCDYSLLMHDDGHEVSCQ